MKELYLTLLLEIAPKLITKIYVSSYYFLFSLFFFSYYARGRERERATRETALRWVLFIGES
jgi:hypothetical protein